MMYLLFLFCTRKTTHFKAVDAAMEVYKNRSRRIKTSVLNEWLEEAVQRHNPPSHKGKYIKIKYVTQLPMRYPAFAFFCNYPEYVKDSYRNYLENFIRKHADFKGVPIGIFFRKK